LHTPARREAGVLPHPIFIQNSTEIAQKAKNQNLRK